MRWYWFDKFTEFVSGSHAVGIKCVSVAEPQMELYQPGLVCHPHSLIIEGFAQLGGLLLGEHGGFQKRVVLAKVSKAVFHDFSQIGDVLTYRVEMDDVNEQGSLVKATNHCGDKLLTEAELMFAHVPSAPGIPDEMFQRDDFLAMLDTWNMYEVAIDQQGQPLQPPPHLVEALEQLAEKFPDTGSAHHLNGVAD